jgi:hypothetical protein
MAITVKHSKVSTIPDDADTSLVRPSDWNADHTLVGTVPVANGGTGAATLTGYVKGNGTATMTASATVPSTDITGLGTMSTQNSNNISVTGGTMSGVTISDYVATATKGVANGVASLDGSGTVPIAQLPAAVLGALSYQGTWNASTNTPTLTSSVGTKGYYYVVSVAGSTNLNGITDWVVGDWAVYNGSAWQKVDNTDAVTSVNGYTGTVILTAADVSAVPYTGATGAVDLNNKSLTNVSNLGVGTSTVPTIKIRAVGDNNSSSRIAMRGYSSDANSSAIRVTKFRGTAGAPQAPQSGDSLGKFELAGYGTTSSEGYPQASVEGVATEAWGATARGTKALVKVTPNTTTTQVTALTIDQDSKATFASTVTANGVLLTGNTGTVTSVAATAGTGITVSGSPITTSGTLTITNSAPDQTVVLTAGTGISTSGTYPNFTITNTSPSSGGTVTSVTGTSPVVSSGGNTPAISMPAATTSVNGYLTSTDWNTFNNKGSGTVTSVSATSPVTSSGGATPNIAMPAATTSVSGYLTSTDWTTFNNKSNTNGTVTSVAALTLGTTGTDLSSTVATGTTTPVITLQVPTASATNRGALSAADWTTFNNKGSGTVTAVSVASANGFAGTSSGGATPALTLTTSISGVLKGNGAAISAATSGTDYSAGTSALGTGILKSTTTTGALTIAVAADFPTLNQNTTGTASNVTGTVALANGGTGQTTAAAAFNALNPMTTTGDIIYEASASTAARLPIGTTGQVLTVAGGIPSWATASGGGNASYDTPTTSTGYFALSAGTTAQRPASPASGMTRYNTSSTLVEFYNGTAWNIVSSSSTAPTIEYLVVAGGGGGATTAGAGGGAGGFRTSTGYSVAKGTAYTVTVGAGGAAATADGGNGVAGSNSVFDTITSIGGGYGAHVTTGGSGGSGGGGGYSTTSGGSGTSGQGNNGGSTSGTGAPNYACAGGGGAGAVGGNASGSTGGNGGNGTASSITGSSVTYAGGGGGSGLGGTTGGTGGGGNGGTIATGRQNGTANTGGGGGGGGAAADGKGLGGSGIVVIRYLDVYPAATSTTGSPTVTTSGGYRIYSWTSSGSITF